MQEKIAIYGGAFDPPHLVHEKIVKYILDNNYADKVIIAPSGEREDKKYKVNSIHRKNILDIFMKSLIGYNVEFCDYFMTAGVEDNLTAGVDRYFIHKLGFSPIQVFGTDALASIKEWDAKKRAALIIPKIFIYRGGFDPSNYDLNGIKNYTIIDMDLGKDLANLSSTQIRNGGIYHFLNSEIADYIKKNGLYK
ncbi:MAG: hypothetical protein PHO80_04070 [Candidatus Gracilibacteria bacterium]|nr:hypothetical protein [Candidatus Gracilibacteria bacterium]